MTIDPEFADAWLGIGISYDELSLQQKALPYIRKAITLSPGIADYHFILGDILIKLSLIDEGIAAYRKVIELNPENIDIWLDLSVVYADQGNPEEGLRILAEGSRYHDRNPDFGFLKAWYLMQIGRLQESGALFEEALEMDYEGLKRLWSTFPESSRHPVLLDLLGRFQHSRSGPETTT